MPDMKQVVQALEELLRAILRGILDDPAAAQIECAQAGSTIVFSITLPPRNGVSELGRLLGREAETIWAIRRIIHVAAAKHRCHVTLEATDGRQAMKRVAMDTEPPVS